MKPYEFDLTDPRFLLMRENVRKAVAEEVERTGATTIAIKDRLQEIVSIEGPKGATRIRLTCRDPFFVVESREVS